MVVTKSDIELSVTTAMDNDLVALMKLSPSDRPAAMVAFEVKRQDAIKTAYDKAKLEESTKIDSEAKARLAFQTLAMDNFKVAWAKLLGGATNLEYVTGVTFQVMRDGETMTYGEPTLILGGLKKLPTKGSGKGTGRGVKHTVNGTEYASIKEIKDTFKLETGQTSWEGVSKLLKDKGHTVS